MVVESSSLSVGHLHLTSFHSAAITGGCCKTGIVEDFPDSRNRATVHKLRRRTPSSYFVPAVADSKYVMIPIGDCQSVA